MKTKKSRNFIPLTKLESTVSIEVVKGRIEMELNQKIFEWLNPKGHWHDWRNDAAILCHTCRKCGVTWSSGWNPNPQYMLNPAAMSDLLQAITKKGYRFIAWADDYDAKWTAKLETPDEHATSVEAESDTLPMAVALAVGKLIDAETTTTATDAGLK